MVEGAVRRTTGRLRDRPDEALGCAFGQASGTFGLVALDRLSDKICEPVAGTLQKMLEWLVRCGSSSSAHSRSWLRTYLARHHPSTFPVGHGFVVGNVFSVEPRRRTQAFSGGIR